MNAEHNKEGEEKAKEHLEKYLTKSLPLYLSVMQKRLIANGNQSYLVGDSVTIADFVAVHVAYTYFMNEHNKFYKEQ